MTISTTKVYTFFKCAVDVSFIDFIMSSNEVIPFVLHIMYNACKVITQ